MSPRLFKSDAQGVSSPTSPNPQPNPPNDRNDKSRRRDRRDQGTISLFGAGLALDGEITSQGDIQIEGIVNGNLSVDGLVSIAASGAVEGDIVSERVIVAGKVQGTIQASESVQLVDGAEVDADIKCPRLELAEGATLNGRVDMSERGGRAEDDEDRGKRSARADANQDRGKQSGNEPASEESPARDVA